MKNKAIVIPSNRPKSLKAFLKRWDEQFKKHDVYVVVVVDGKTPHIELDGKRMVFLYNPELIPNRCAGVRNMGFQFVAERLPSVEYIITLDDDISPDGDTIGDHIEILNSRLPSSWFSTLIGAYPRGFPYAVREETEVVMSHGVWRKNPDWDAPTQLLNNNADHTNFQQGLIPKGLYFPMCGMNVAFKRKALPYVYYAPVNTFKGAERWDDIWAGLYIKKDFDRKGWGIATGYASSIHERESDVFHNLEKEAVGLRHNEKLWLNLATYDEDKWFKKFRKMRRKWYNSIKKYE